MPRMIQNVLDDLDYYELLKLKKDLEKGSSNIKKLVNKKIVEKRLEHEAFCASCGAKIDLSNENVVTLIFGSDDFKKKASFCGTDCLKFFVLNSEEEK